MRSPIVLREFHAPKARAGRKKFHADARAFVGGFANVNDAAVLLFFGRRIHQDDLRADGHVFTQIEQTSVRVDDHGLAILFEFAALAVFPLREDGNAREYAGAAAGTADLDVRRWHELWSNGLRGESTGARARVPKEAGGKMIAVTAGLP